MNDGEKCNYSCRDANGELKCDMYEEANPVVKRHFNDLFFSFMKKAEESGKPHSRCGLKF